MWVRDKVPRHKMMVALDQAAEYLASAEEDGELNQWLCYLLEAIESQVGGFALDHIDEILAARFAHGRW